VKPKIKYRKAKLADIDRLVQIENECFNYDQLDAKKFKYFIEKGHDDLVVQTVDDTISSYGLLLYRRGTSLSRLYSIAVSKSYRGKSLGEALLKSLETFSSDNDSSYIRLEVKASNKPAIKLYEKLGYNRFAIKHQYYDNDEDAICFEKKVQVIGKKEKKLNVPFYKQTTEFTCGPSSLMMAMKTLDQNTKITRAKEIEIWREATTIFMTSGHGGCGPHGLAISAHKRGFRVELLLVTKELLFVTGVRQKVKKDIIKIVQEQFNEQIKEKNIPVIYGKISWTDVDNIIKNNGIAIILINSYRLTESNTPHWVVLTGMNEDFLFFHDPYVEEDDSIFTNTNIPIRRDEFEMMTKKGSKQILSLVAIYPGK